MMVTIRCVVWAVHVLYFDEFRELWLGESHECIASTTDLLYESGKEVK